MDTPDILANLASSWISPARYAELTGLMSPRTVRRHCASAQSLCMRTATIHGLWPLPGISEVTRTPGGYWRLRVADAEVSA